MKKLLALFLTLCLILTFSGCGGKVFSEFEAMQAEFDEFILGEYETEYSEIVSEFETLTKKDKKEAKELFERLSLLYEDVLQSNSEMLGDIISTMKSEGDTLEGKDKKAFESAIEKAEKSIESKKFVSAFDILAEYMFLAPDSFESEQELDIKISQVDCSAYPTIKLFLTVTDQSGNTPKNLDKRYFTVIENGDGIRRQISNIMQLDQQEGINIAMVADASGSMEGSAIYTAKETMTNFLGQVQYKFGDKVSLVVFDDQIEKQTAFVSDYQSLKNDISSIYTSGGTALYDTLYTTVQYTARQSGARCVIAFTDGEDIHSEYADESDVIRIANDYKIPIFIIGIGASTNNYEIRSIAEQTGGFYKNITDVSDLSDIYASIYRQQKEMYIIEYTADDDKKYSEHSPSVTYKSAEFEGGDSGYSFIPSQVNPGESGSNDLETAIGNYLKSYVKAMNESNPSHMLPYVIAGCPLYKMQSNYVNNDYYEELLSYYICSEVNYESESSCVLSVHEVYNVQTPDRPLYHHEQVATYRMKKDADGIWKMYEFVGSVKNHL